MIVGIFDESFFRRLAEAGVRFRMVDDPMAIAAPVELIRVGAAGLYADGPVDDATLAQVSKYEDTLRIFVGGFGLAELRRSHRLTDADAEALVALLLHPEALNFLLTEVRDR